MQLTTTEKVLICTDREGEQREHLRININVTKKDDVSKIYTIKTFDSIVFNEGTEFESTTPKLNRYGQIQEKEYFKTYAEYDSEREQLLQAFPSSLIGSELDDYVNSIKDGDLKPVQVSEGYQDHKMRGNRWDMNDYRGRDNYPGYREDHQRNDHMSHERGRSSGRGHDDRDFDDYRDGMSNPRR